MKRFASAVLILVACALLAGPALSTPLLTDAPDSMATYCDVQDVKDAYDDAELASVTGDPQKQSIDDSKIQEAIEDYGSYIERHVRMQHPDNPFDSSDGFLNSMNVDGAYYTLEKRAPNGIGEEVRKSLERLDTILMRIASGKLDLMDQDQIDDAPSDPLNPDNLIEKKSTEFGIHRRLPGYLNA